LSKLLTESEELLKISESDFQKMIQKEPLEILRDRELRMESVVREFAKMPHHQAKIRELKLKLTQEIAKRDVELRKEQQKIENQQTEKIAKEHIFDFRDVRYSISSMVRSLMALGVEKVPLNTLQWNIPTDTTLEIRTASGNKGKFDFTKIPLSLWKTILEQPFTPIYLTLESMGMHDKKNKPIPIWSDQSDYSKVAQQRPHPSTVIAIMRV
jgi:hypothetical protein